MKNIELETEITKIILKSPVETDLKHAKSTKKWVLKLKPNADYALQISALAHDIERGFESDQSNKINEDFNNYKEKKIIHSKKSANIITGLLKKYNFEKKLSIK